MNETAILEVIPIGYVPAYFLYIIVGVLLLSFLGLTAAYKQKSSKWGNFIQVMIFTIIISGIVTWSFTTMPEVIVEQITKLKTFFGI